MRRTRLLRTLVGAPLVLAALIAACSSDPGPKTSGTTPPDVLPEAGLVDVAPDHGRVPFDSGNGVVGRVAVKSELVSSRVDVRALMFAAGEMQISGEPFAEGFAGRNLGNYDRTYLPTDQYILDNGGDNPVPSTDLFGFSTAVESYEYSKYHMNMICQQSTAGLALAVGPVIATHAGATPLERMRGRAAELITAAGTDVSGYAFLPAPEDNPLNYLGFQGLWPNFAPFRSFDPAMLPHDQVVKSCTFAGGYGGIPTIGATIPEYECAYNSLHLTERDKQVERVLSPGVLGLATWKQALWGIDFSGRIHDAGSNPVDAVADADGPSVGLANNLVRGTEPPNAARGTYLGSNPLEGMWGLMMLANMDNAAELLTSSLTTTDGKALGGFASRAAATAYDYDSPLRWFPGAVDVTEDKADPYPNVTAMTISDGTSHAEDLAALLLGHAMWFGMTDARNAGIGQLVGLKLTFDGDPFPADDGLANGEATAHDRALAVMRVAFIDLDRMHMDPAAGVAVDTASVSNGAIARGTTVSTPALAHTIIALRQTLLSLNGAITQYGAADPDPAADANGALNVAPIHPVAGGGAQPTFSARVRSVFTANAKFVRDVLTQPSGAVANGATIANGVATATTGPAMIEAQTAAIRALVEGFLVTGDESYRVRARAVATHLQATFYSAQARMFRGTESGKDEIHMGPETFAWLQSALRETHKVLHITGDKALGRDVLEERIARVNKLFLNGWDDLDGNEVVTGEECLAARLQLAEQALTGELGRDDVGHTTSDRDGDCVPEIDDAKVGSVMPREVFFHSP
jgi:hypothetical protein